MDHARPARQSITAADLLGGDGPPLFFTDGLLEARDRSGHLFRLDQQIDALCQPDLQAAADELLDRLRDHTRHRLDDDVAVLLADLTLTDPGLRRPALGEQPEAGASKQAA